MSFDGTADLGILVLRLELESMIFGMDFLTLKRRIKELFFQRLRND